MASETSVNALTDIQMVSARRGWAVGAGRILATQDGVRWKSQYSGPEVLVAINAIDSMHAWAVGQQLLLGTSDGGQHWNELGQPDESLRSVHFFDPDQGFGIAGLALVVSEEGYAIGRSQSGTVVSTSDGGRTWQDVPAPCDAQSVCFTSVDDGWLVAGGRVYRSQDGGASWTEVLDVPEGKPRHGTLQCASSSAAWVLFAADDGAMSHRAYVAYHSEDAGRNWNAVVVEGYTNQEPRVIAPQGPGTYPGPISVLGPREAVIVGYTPPLDEPTAIVTATDGGRALGENRPIPLKQYFPSGASFVSRLQGWVVGSDGASSLLVATADGGRTWTTQDQVKRR